jgi:hypothetical protein
MPGNLLRARKRPLGERVHEIYKRTRLGQDTPRIGDFAEIVRDHHNDESGLIVRVLNDPHLADVICAQCGQTVREFIVEVAGSHPKWDGVPGPHFYPITWLRRLGPLRLIEAD